MRMMTMEEILIWIQDHGQILIVCLGGATTLILTLVLLRRFRNTRVAKIGHFVSGPLVLAWEAQGVYQIAHHILGLPVPAAVLGAGLTGSVLITLGAQAHEHWQRHKVLGPNGRLMLMVALPMGLIVALSAHTSVEVGMRIAVPLLAYIVFRSRYMPDEPPGAERKRGTFRWTPHRIGVAWGLVDPTDADIAVVHRTHRIQLLVKLARKAHGARMPVLRDWYGRRLQRHAQLADDGMMAEVVAACTRAEMALELTSPKTTQAQLLEMAANIAARRMAITGTETEKAVTPAAVAAATQAEEDHAATRLERAINGLFGTPSQAVPGRPDGTYRPPLPHPVPLHRSDVRTGRPDGPPEQSRHPAARTPGHPAAVPPYIPTRRPPQQPTPPPVDDQKDRHQLELIARTYPHMSWDELRAALQDPRLSPSLSDVERVTRIRRPRIKKLLLETEGLAERHFPNAGADLIPDDPFSTGEFEQIVQDETAAK